MTTVRVQRWPHCGAGPTREPAAHPLWRGTGAPTTGHTTAPAFDGWSDPARVGQPDGKTVSGLLTFRGNPTRTFYGTDPMPRTTPAKQWRFPRSGGLCAESTDDKGTRQWCGPGGPGSRPSSNATDGPG